MLSKNLPLVVFLLFCLILKRFGFYLLFFTDESLNVFQKVYRILLFMWVFIESILLSATNYLNRFSRNYRIVSRALKKEKIILKEFTDFTKGSRRGSNQIWQPNYTFHALMEKAK